MIFDIFNLSGISSWMSCSEWRVPISHCDIAAPDSFSEIASDCFINAGPQLIEVSAAVAAAVGKGVLECQNFARLF
jgi:hypothetical protein